ncbi:zinc finger and BTB domain-containing protein 41-like [Diabrotica virgifera virgifera]|uniref:Zinc finger and BTB domain-containing protein 41-like n=1 Tax=Diabrotica virgifera virgifera TaxID=50390 RepID=A0A6P7GMT1_DIAVI|nr:zinc finger and BTB domain-containing protein 41-like [Diabrotica virgifera virgifera]
MDSKDLIKGWKKCEICNKTFVSMSNFRTHIKLKHPDDVEKLDPGAKPSAKCNVCNKSIDKRYMTKHLKLKHPELEETLPSTSKKIYDCTLCHKKFDTLQASLKHNHKRLKMLRCSLCEYENPSQEKLISHMKMLHSIDINSQNLTFDSVEKFEQWKAELEKSTVSKYNITHGSYVTQKYKRSQYNLFVKCIHYVFLINIKYNIFILFINIVCTVTASE